MYKKNLREESLKEWMRLTKKKRAETEAETDKIDSVGIDQETASFREKRVPSVTFPEKPEASKAAFSLLCV